jgi:hypothetical protein
LYVILLKMIYKLRKLTIIGEKYYDKENDIDMSGQTKSFPTTVYLFSSFNKNSLISRPEA